MILDASYWQAVRKELRREGRNITSGSQRDDELRDATRLVLELEWACPDNPIPLPVNPVTIALIEKSRLAAIARNAEAAA